MGKQFSFAIMFASSWPDSLRRSSSTQSTHMKTLLSFITFSVVLLHLQSSVAFAQGQRPAGIGGGGNEMFTAVDSNSDGVLDAAELANAAAALKKLDKNGDGTITKDEVATTGGFGMGGRGGMAPGAATPGTATPGTTTPGSQPPTAPMSGMGKGKGKGKGGQGPAPSTNPDEAVQTLMQFDKNADGKLSKDEVPERMQGIFENSDANKDGLLSPDEIKAAAASSSGGAGAAAGRRPF